MRKIVICFALFLSSCGDTAPEKDETAVKNAETAVKNEMNDPSSAQFRNIRVITKKIVWKDQAVTPVVCGEANGKNRMGGYVGFEKFAYIPEKYELVIADQDSVRKLCE